MECFCESRYINRNIIAINSFMLLKQSSGNKVLNFIHQNFSNNLLSMEQGCFSKSIQDFSIPFGIRCITVCYNKKWIRVLTVHHNKSVYGIKIILTYPIFNKSAQYLGRACNNYYSINKLNPHDC